MSHGPSQEEAGIIQKVSHCDWATPVVAVPKRDGSYRICGDYKVAVNAALEVDQYPLPNPSDLFASLSGGKKRRFISGLSAAVYLSKIQKI